MKTEHMKNYNYATIQEFYAQGIVSQAQWEAYDFIFSHTSSGQEFPYFWGSLLPDARVEFRKLYRVLPAKVQKILRHVAIG
jgi:hypothetical protein